MSLKAEESEQFHPSPVTQRNSNGYRGSNKRRRTSHFKQLPQQSPQQYNTELSTTPQWIGSPNFDTRCDTVELISSSIPTPANSQPPNLGSIETDWSGAGSFDEQNTLSSSDGSPFMSTLAVSFYSILSGAYCSPCSRIIYPFILLSILSSGKYMQMSSLTPMKMSEVDTFWTPYLLC